MCGRALPLPPRASLCAQDLLPSCKTVYTTAFGGTSEGLMVTIKEPVTLPRFSVQSAAQITLSQLNLRASEKDTAKGFPQTAVVALVVTVESKYRSGGARKVTQVLHHSSPAAPTV